MKIVINNCYGGFGLSEKAYLRYVELKGIILYPEEKNQRITYWVVPEKPKLLNRDFYQLDMENRKNYNKVYTESTLNDTDIPRNDKTLVQVIEELGKEANGDHANLIVVEIPDDVKWEIEEYDGNEHVAEKHRTWG